MKYNFPENIFGGFLQVFLPCVCDESGRPLASILTTRPPHSWMHFTSPHIYIACSIICAYCATATCAYFAFDAHCYFDHAIYFSKNAIELHGIFHLRTSAAGTINPTLCPHLPPTLGYRIPPNTQAGIGGQPLWSSPMSGAVKIWQILWIRCDKYYCWPAAKNSWCVPRFRQMMIHFHHFPWCGAIFWVECFFEEMFWHLLAGVRRLVGEWWLL